VTSLGSAIFAFLAAGTFKSIEEAQDKICPPHRVFEPDRAEQKVYDELYRVFSRIYWAFGEKRTDLGDVLPTLIGISGSQQQRGLTANSGGSS
jgi:L-ribulokinase